MADECEMMSDVDDKEVRSIATRISRLNQMFLGRGITTNMHTQASRESLLDALFALYDECNNVHFMRNQYIAYFVNKYKQTVEDMRNLRINIKDFNIKNTIGRGHFGEVQVVREKHTGDVYALKVLRKSDTLAQKNVAFYEEERDIMAKSCSVWITQLQYAFQDKHSLYFVMEFHPGGDLLSLLARFDDMFEEKMARFYLAEMVLALRTLHNMGYVHRDVKPENILIDRTGHVKLADFGSACRLTISNASVANMPVGTPDYISPEVLRKMNSNDLCGQFGPECDWWSLGVCAYEMLYGKTPFTDENGSMVVTYANIMNHKKCLKFPSNEAISGSATSLMSKLLTDAECRLDYDRICGHSFFKDLDFDNIRQVRPPFIPTVTSNDDTSNFDDFEKIKRGPDTQSFTQRGAGLTGNDLPFIGFTFTKSFAMNDRPSLTSEVASPAAKGSLERRLNQKSQELTDVRERHKELEHKLAGSTCELNRLRNQMSDRDGRIEKLEAERRMLELDKAHYMTEVKSLTRLLEMEKQDRQQTEEKAMNLLDDIRAQSGVAQQLREQTNKQDLTEHQDVITQLEEENRLLSEKLCRLENTLGEETAARLDATAKVDLMKAKITELKTTLRDQDTSQREVKLQKELDKVNQQRYEAVELLSTMRQSKTRLEEELYMLRRRSNVEDILRTRISDEEESRRVLEVHIHRLELVEKREEVLRDQYNEKSQQVVRLSERISDLEEVGQMVELEHCTRTKLSQQREEQLRQRIKDIESAAETIQNERYSLEEQSMIMSEDAEERLNKIYQQEETIAQLRSNVGKLESQLEVLRVTMENEAAANASRKSRRSMSADNIRCSRPEFAKADTPPWKSLRYEGQRTVQTQTRQTQTGHTNMTQSVYRQSNGVQVDMADADKYVSPRQQRSNQMQTDDSPYVTSRRVSSNTQTDTPKRSNDVKTEVVVQVSMCAGSESPITEEEDDDSNDVTETITDVTETTTTESPPDLANVTIIHSGQGDSVMKGRSRRARAEEEQEQKLKQEEKEKCRRDSEEWSDLQQQKAYLEMRVSNLDAEVAEYKESAHQQRLRALDLKIELRDKSTSLTQEVSELKERLNTAELSVSEAREASSNSTQREATLKDKLEHVQHTLDDIRIESRRKVTDLTMDRDDLQASVKALTSKVSALEPKEQELRQYQLRCKELEPKNKDLERSLEEAQEDRKRLRLETERYRDELQKLKHEHDKLNVQHTNLKEVAEELDSQLQSFEELGKRHEKQEHKWSSHKSTYEKAVNETETLLEDTQRNLNKERSFRQREEMKVAKFTEEISSLKETHNKKTEAIVSKLNEAKSLGKRLAEQLTALERTNSHLDVDLRTSQRQMEAVSADNMRLKEEISELITTVGDVKASNLKLSKNLEAAMDRYELLASQNTDLQNQAESNMVDANHDKYKMESTLSQQTKLIDYLQAKVENPPKKKKWLFGSKRTDGMSLGIQFREMQHSLEHERSKNSILRQTITRLQTELYQKQAYDQVDAKRSSATEVLTLTPSSRSSKDSSSIYSVPKAKVGGSRPRKERMHHNIPHRFVTGLNSRATKCAVCLGSVHFVKQAAKCQECFVVCHPKCAANLPASCGLPTEYVSHFSEVMQRQSSSRISVADLRLTMSTWMKIPRPGKQLWEKKWVSLSENHIHIYSTQDTSQDHVEEFLLCPPNGTVTVHSAVTAAELTNTVSSDLPYILRLEFEPETTCWPGRSVYLMALSFEEKQRWVATLEAIVHHSRVGQTEAKLLGNTLLTLSGDKRVDMNCTLPINNQAVLVGTDDGLFVMNLTPHGETTSPLTKVVGVTAVYQMEVIYSLDLVVMITGRDRQVVLVGLREVQLCAEGATQPSITPHALSEAAACTTLTCGLKGVDTFLCTALAEYILIFVYDHEEEEFVLAKELLTAQACSCIHFGEKHVIVGTDKFYKIGLEDFHMSDLLDKRDASLAFAAFGAAHYDSFPIAILQVAGDDEPDEYLLCFHEFGVFVSNTGRRSRDDDVKWRGLPLAFAYQAPYLYTIHFNAVQVMQIPADHQHHSEGLKTMLRLPSPQYLGPALSAGAVYISTSSDTTTEIMCFKGNMVTGGEGDQADKENSFTRPGSKKSKRHLATPVEHEDHNLSSTDSTSPPRITKLDRSPLGSVSRNKMPRLHNQGETSDTETTTTTGSDSAPPVRIGVTIRARAEERRRRKPCPDSSDTSF